jgi:hypothetical protein
MKKGKEKIRLERRQRLVQALKANLTRRKAEHRKERASPGSNEAQEKRELSQEGCPGSAIVLGTGDTGGCKR